MNNHFVNPYKRLMMLRHNILFLPVVIVMFCNCNSDSVADATAVRDISAAAAGSDSTHINPINLPPLNYVRPGEPVPLKNMFGINAYEWNFLENPASPNDRKHIYEDKYALIKTFSAVRHYLNWNRMESVQGQYTFNPAFSGNWDYDVIYQRCKQDSILMLADLKNCPDWMVNTYPASSRDNDNAPAPYRKNLADPASYIAMAHMGFQFAARYGYNKNISPALIKTYTQKRYPDDVPNQALVGLGLIKYIECGNERDRWWGGDETHQTAEQYAANLSAFYDGDLGKLGKDAGVKRADPAMQVVMGGMASASMEYLQGIINWCKAHRGYKKDGSINLCFDVINYHLYSNNGDVRTHKRATTGIAPEISNDGSIANSFVKVANSLKQRPEVWLTEAGYDINQESYQKAESIGAKSALQQQADWIIRTSLFYIRYGVKRVFYYQLFDDHAGGTTQYATSGLNEGLRRRPAADYILQTGKLMGNYNYVKTIHLDPLADVYQLGKKTMYVLTIPDETGRSADYKLDLGHATKAKVYHLRIGADKMDESVVNTNNGKLTVHVTETPVFVEAAQ